MIDGRKDSGSTAEPPVSFNRRVPPRNANIYAKRTPSSGKQPIASSNHTPGRMRPSRRAFGLINSASRSSSVHQLRASSVTSPLRREAEAIIAIRGQRCVAGAQINRRIRLVSRVTLLPFIRTINPGDGPFLADSPRIYNSKNRGASRLSLIRPVHSALRMVSSRLRARPLPPAATLHS